MGRVARAYQPQQNSISQSRAAKSVAITLLAVGLLLGLGYHLYWAIFAVLDNRFGDSISNLVFGFGTLALNGILSFKLLVYLNETFIDNTIDADHKKYL